MANRILDNFDMAALRAERARRNARGNVSLTEGLRQIAPEIEKLKVGQTAKLEIPGYEADPKGSVRKYVMAITAKVSNLTVKGGEWEGRNFEIANDGAGALYVQRGKDLKGSDIPVRNRRGGGRKKADTPSDGTTTVDNGGALVTEHN